MSEALTLTESGALVEQQAISGDMLSRFIAYLDASAKTAETYTRALRQFFTYIYLNDIVHPAREDVIAFRDDLKASGHKPTTVQNYITAVRLFFQWTELEHLYPNIAQHLKGAKLDRQHKKDYLTSAQVKEILNSIERDTVQGLRDYAIMTLMITGGLRTIEVSRANIEDLRIVGDSPALFLQGKGREEKTEFVKIPLPVDRAIRAYLKARGRTSDSDPLFISLSNNSKGGRMSTRSVSGIVKQRMQAAGYDSERLTAHSLRHTAVTLSLLAGKDITEVQQFARHSNVSTTMIYAHHLEKTNNSCSAAISDAIF